MAHDENFRLTLGRRGFLRWVAGGVAAATAGLYGCGGSGGGDGGGGEIPVRSISEDDRHACLDAIQAFLDTIADLPLDEQAAQALTFVRTRPEFVDSDIDEDGVWAIFIDAVPLMLFFNRPLGPNPIAGPDFGGRAPNDMPDSTTAMLINTLGPYYTDETLLIKPLLQGNGYSTIVDPGTVESLRAFNDDGVFYFSAHSGMTGIPILNANGNFVRTSSGRIQRRSAFGVMTSTRIERATASQYTDDLRQGRLGMSIARYGTGQPGSPRSMRQYAFTAAFVDTYMNFGQDSLVWFSSCNSNNARSAAFVQSCINAGAGLYVGWSRQAGEDECIACSTFIFDRLLGANATTPLENPLQRPFDYVKVWQDMAAQGLPTGLVYTVGSGNIGLLAPTIAYVLINEFDEEAHLFGTFGNPASNEREVTIGGTPVTVKTWAPDKIVVELPQDGAGSSGDVEVTVRGHKSNKRQITHWRVDVNYAWLHTAMPPLSTEGLFAIEFRADVGHYRENPGVPPLEPVRWAIPKRSSLGELFASGSIEVDGCTNTWSGFAQFPPGGFDFPPPDYMVVTRLKIDTDTRAGMLGMSLGILAGPPFTWTVECPDDTNSQAFMVTEGLLEGTGQFLSPDPNNTKPIELPKFDFTFTSDYKIPAHHFIDNSFAPIKIDITWAEVTPASPPDPNAARGRDG